MGIDRHMFRIVNILRAVLFIMSSMLYMASCRSEKEPRSQSLIVGGTPVSSENPAAKSLVALVSSQKGTLRSFCSGTLVAPRLVLTAAHCIEGIRQAQDIQVFFGSSINDKRGVRRSVVAMRSYTTEAQRFYPNFDIAWLRLGEQAPWPYHPIEILRDPALLPVNTELLLAGFGKSSTNCTGEGPPCSGIAREALTPLKRSVNSAHFRHLLLTGPTPGSGSCNGDSGGPAYVFVKDKWYLAGLLHGKNFLLNGPAILNSEQICESGVSTYTFAGAYADWIEASGGTQLPLDAPNSIPPPSAEDAQELGQESTLADYLAYDHPGSEIWYTAGTMLAGFKDADKAVAGDLDTLVSNPERAAQAMEKWEAFSSSGLGISLNNLSVQDQQLSDLRPLAFLKSLKNLELSDHKIVDTSPLGQLKNLESLKLSKNYDLKTMRKIPWNLDFLSHLPKLKTLNLLANGESLNLKEVPWNDLPHLETLILSNNAGSLNLYDVPWKRLRRLKQLLIASSELSDITPLAGAKSLEQLNLRRNRISDISVLEGLKNLRVLDVSQNQIEDFQPVVALDRLETLLALGNPNPNAAPCPASASCIYTPQASY